MRGVVFRRTKSESNNIKKDSITTITNINNKESVPQKKKSFSLFKKKKESTTKIEPKVEQKEHKRRPSISEQRDEIG